ncbi:hypothetical protein KGF54_000090 [Candida jiufengensis]|uniref:uncharacterized protein n=1 Tax=Candida jiufengensis TaxID=497108 RepID=UPI0022250A2E|nr:uncharacterized protein KGF54_000090 [Candida jiufengensis]KAI5957162.1 hypothetical protein KGF54_000090 [Candida jiufengensis]
MKAPSPSYSNSSKISKSSSESLESQPISSGTDYTIEEDKYHSSSSSYSSNNSNNNRKHKNYSSRPAKNHNYNDEDFKNYNMNNKESSQPSLYEKQNHQFDDTENQHYQQRRPSNSNEQQPKNDLIASLNEFIFIESNTNDLGYCNFPVVLKIQIESQPFEEEIKDLVSEYPKLSIVEEFINTLKYFIINFKSKSSLDDFIYRLYDEKIPFELDYSKFVSHPGVLFIKNLSSELIFEMDQNESFNGSTEFLTITPKSINNNSNNEQHKLYEFLIDNCYFKSLQELKIFNNNDLNNKNNSDSKLSNSNNTNASSSAFAIVKFSNYLDVDILIEKFNRHTPNIFNENQSIPLFLNKYLNKRERSSPFGNKGIIQSSNNNIQTNLLSRSSINSNNLVKNSSNDNFNLIILENLNNFLSIDEHNKMTLEKFIEFLDVFQKFGNIIESIYFPFVQDDQEANSGAENPTLKNVKFFDFGYIKFKSNVNLMDNTLRILYYLNDLKYDEFMSLNIKDLPSLLEDKDIESTNDNKKLNGENHETDSGDDNDKNNENDNKPVSNDKLSITIAQHKHNHYLFSQANQFYLSYNNGANLHLKQNQQQLNQTDQQSQSNQLNIHINYPNPIHTINTFLRSLNYQETNIYVNNLSIVFANDDLNWEKFWKQFGAIKSAKIIKPQFYNQQQQLNKQDGSTEQLNKDSEDKDYEQIKDDKVGRESEGLNDEGDEEESEQKSGRIGFIFYESFKMAIRAILMTNNKIIHIDNFNPMIIQSSFAIQKSSNNNNNNNNSVNTNFNHNSQHLANNYNSPYNNNTGVSHFNYKYNLPLNYLHLNNHQQTPLPHHVPNHNHYSKYNNYSNQYTQQQPLNSQQPQPKPVTTSINPAFELSSTSSNNPTPTSQSLNINPSLNPSTGYNNSIYYTYQPSIPYYYGYHPNPYQYGASTNNSVLNNYIISNDDQTYPKIANSQTIPKKINGKEKEKDNKSKPIRQQSLTSHHPVFTNYLLHGQHQNGSGGNAGYPLPYYFEPGHSSNLNQ